MKSDCNGKHTRKIKALFCHALNCLSQENARLPSASGCHSESSATSLAGCFSAFRNKISSKAGAAAGPFWQNSDFQWQFEDSFPKLFPLVLWYLLFLLLPTLNIKEDGLCFSFLLFSSLLCLSWILTFLYTSRVRQDHGARSVQVELTQCKDQQFEGRAKWHVCVSVIPFITLTWLHKPLLL